MNIKDLQVGDRVYIREDLIAGEVYGGSMYIGPMGNGWCTIIDIGNEDTFLVDKKGTCNWNYSPEMIDWENTKKMNYNKRRMIEIPSGELFYYISSGGYVDYDRFDVSLAFHRDLFRVNNFFKTRESAALKLKDIKDSLERELMIMQDNVNSPSHYMLEGLDIESVDVIKSVLGKEKFIGWVWGNSLKYLIRQEKKNGLEDIKKAMKNLEWLIDALEEGKNEY